MKLKNSSCISLCGTFERVKVRTIVHHAKTLGSLTYVYKVVSHMGTFMEIPLYFIYGIVVTCTLNPEIYRNINFIIQA